MLTYLLDTNIAIDVITRRPVEVMGVFNDNAGRMAISSITLSELWHGAEKVAKVAQNLAVLAGSEGVGCPDMHKSMAWRWR